VKTAARPATSAPDPAALLRSRAYLRLLVLAALLGVPISAAAYGFLALVAALQGWIYDDLPHAFGFGTAPDWWSLPVLAIAGVLVGATIRYLPGRGGHVPAEGLKVGGAPAGPAQLPGVVAAAVAGLGLGAVIGPEAPLIALGGGLAAMTLRLSRRELPERAVAVVAASGSFAAISALLGSPLAGAFLLMEASGLGGATLELVLVPGLLSAGIGALIFVGLGDWTGLGTYSLAVQNLPGGAHPTVAQFGWAVVIGLAAVVVGASIRRSALALAPLAARRIMLVTPTAGIVIGLCVIAFTTLTGQRASLVLFSGQDQISTLLGNAYPVGALVAVIAAKGIAYTVSLAAFRGGPIFPAMFIGAAGGLAMSSLPGLEPVAAAAMGIAAMATVMLGLPLTSVLLATLLLNADGLKVMPMVIVAVVVAYVGTAAARSIPRRGVPGTTPAGPRSGDQSAE
jgi:H+/Cl- antiporter ClcA